MTLLKLIAGLIGIIAAPNAVLIILYIGFIK
jgi:hypothetical protein